MLGVIWRWLGYAGGMPLNRADLLRLLDKHSTDMNRVVNQAITEQIVPQLNDIRARSDDKEARRLNVATQILSGLCAARAQDPALAVYLADKLLQELR